jgi:hypothetical protein
MRYIVTNTTPEGNYMPSVFTKATEAAKWFKELAVENIKAAYENELKEGFMDLYGDDNLEFDESADCILKYANENFDVKISNNKIEIYYADDSFNIIQLFEVEI